MTRDAPFKFRLYTWSQGSECKTLPCLRTSFFSTVVWLLTARIDLLVVLQLVLLILVPLTYFVVVVCPF